jgi:hypothetical protein
METWKTIPNWEDYQVSNLGRVRSLKSEILLMMKLSKDPKGYEVVQLYSVSKRKRFKVHQLVAIAFLDHNTKGMDLVVDHINSNKSDNRLENLRIITQRDNVAKERILKSNLPTGISIHKKTNKFRSRIFIAGKQKYLGLFNTPEEASEAYQKELNKIKQT